jgi:type III restriction enzyme
MSIAYDGDLVESIGHSLDLRRPNLGALDAIARALEAANAGEEIIADLATGVGKTFIAGALIDYLFEAGVRNVVFVTPGSTIQKKTIDNFTPGHRKYLRGLRSRPLVITLDDLETGNVAAALEDESQLKLFVFTVQSLLKPNSNDARRAHRAHEALGVALYDYLQTQDDVVVIADEHHIYYSGNAKKFQSAIDDLNASATIGLTATPHDSDSPNIVYRYPLAEAIADGYVKIPVLVARQDGRKDLKTQMADGVALLNAKAQVMETYCQRTHKKPVQPILFVVAERIDEANDIRDMLAGPDFLDGDDKVLLVTSEEPDQTLALLDTLEDDGSPIRAVVSVSMLKEGWDVKNIYCIAAVRALESQLLTEQILGRGLRLPFGERTGVPMLDTVEVLSHHSFADLLKEAKVLLEQTLGQRASEASVITNPTPGVFDHGVAPQQLQVMSPQSASSVWVQLPGQEKPLWDESEESTWTSQPNQGMGFSTIEAVLDSASESQKTLQTTLRPQSPGGIRTPLFIPRVVTRWQREPFSLAMLNNVDVEALGSKFADDQGETLTRKAIDARRDEAGQVEIKIYDEVESIAASQQLMDFDDIESDLARRLLEGNGVAATLTEANAAMDVAQAFLRGARVTNSTPWRKSHGQLATAKLLEWITAQQVSRPAREVVEVNQVRWPDPEDRIEVVTPQDRQLINRSSDFVRGFPYKGWSKSVYEVNAFDAYSTEFRLAQLFESTPNVKAWVRVDHTVPLRINYLSGAVQREYMPDFIVIDDNDVHWIVEGKADSEMVNPLVLAKADAAANWVKAVNVNPAVTQRWGYMLCSEAVIGSASSWTSLSAGAQVRS